MAEAAASSETVCQEVAELLGISAQLGITTEAVHRDPDMIGQLLAGGP